MSGETEDDADKEHEASPHKLEQARKRGDIPRAPDLNAAAAIGGLLLALAAFGGWIATRIGNAAVVLLDQSDRLAHLMMARSDGPLGGMLIAFAGPSLVLLLVPGALVLFTILATRGLVFSPEKLMPKLSRISPLAAARQKFGAEGLVAFGKSTLKLALLSGVLYLFLAARLPQILNSLYLGPGSSVLLLAQLLLEFILIVFLIALGFGGVDYLWQVHLHRKRNRMSRKEMMDEYKESEGDPQMKATRRQKAQDVATNRMLQDVATADVVVVNPTHYAVALKWERAKRGAPVCVAKGVDEIARAIRERAAQHGIPLHSDPPTARAIHASVEIGQEIAVEHYRAVAAAIRFADAMRKRARRR